MTSSLETYLTVSQKYSSNTISTYSRSLGRFLSFNKVLLNDKDDLENAFKIFTAQSGLSRSSIVLSYFAVTKLLESRGIYVNLNTKRFALPKKKSKTNKFLTKKQLEELINNFIGRKSGLTSFRDGTILAIFGYLGLRLSELANLKMEDINLIEQLIIIRSGKGNKYGEVPILSIVKPYLLDYLNARKNISNEYLWVTRNGKRLSRRYIQAMTTRAVKELNSELSTHSLRHTAATIYINSGAQLSTVSTLLRHSSIRTTADIYVHQSAESVKKELESVL